MKKLTLSLGFTVASLFALNALAADTPGEAAAKASARAEGGNADVQGYDRPLQVKPATQQEKEAARAKRLAAGEAAAKASAKAESGNANVQGYDRPLQVQSATQQEKEAARAKRKAAGEAAAKASAKAESGNADVQGYDRALTPPSK
ncbi:hypothetical protein PSQ40_00505 [Curvibacter sp. HBC61]|uniref:DUF4148 domain-containing protein n=1 Tax=Curvibacter cyanobacteriorum TaxID=3026422 RepID=A0ABT5MU92_9BURK|nr:hypothetical protein [Curvibacter sp. HBC61]MDD0837041.1 hypothetical protein [Curvibacter sp. HBC61]